MHLEAIIFFNVLLYHLISYFLFRLARFCPFFYFFQRDLALSFAELDIYVDMTVRFFLDNTTNVSTCLVWANMSNGWT